jgi:hypothetical protein
MGNVVHGTHELDRVPFRVHHARFVIEKASIQFCGSTARLELNFSLVALTVKSYGERDE